MRCLDNIHEVLHDEKIEKYTNEGSNDVLQSLGDTVVLSDSNNIFIVHIVDIEKLFGDIKNAATV
jgi:hypothetical protein